MFKEEYYLILKFQKIILYLNIIQEFKMALIKRRIIEENYLLLIFF